MNKKLAALIFTFSFLIISAHAYDSFHDDFLKNFSSKIWTTAEGIQGNTITDLIQASNGYLYIGTYEGLSRFDGVKFLNINKNTDSRLGFLSARAVYEDLKGNLWIGANDEGVTVITKDGKIHQFDVDSGLPNNSVRSLCEDFQGNIWVGTSSGIACISPDFQIFIPKGIEFLPKSNNYLIKKLYCDKLGRVWIITSNSDGAFFYEDEAFHVYSNFVGKSNYQITTVYQDSEGALWYGFDSRSVIREKDGVQENYDISFGIRKGTAVNCIFQDSERNVWVAMDSGIAIFHDGKWFYYSQHDGLADEEIIKILEDREGNIWLGTDRGGLQKFTRSKLHTFIIDETVNSIAQDNFRGVMWFGCDDGLYCMKNGIAVENEITKMCKNVRIRHVDVSKDGCLYISSYEILGQLKIDLDGKVFQWTKENGLAGNKVRVALEISNGDIYVGTTTGLSIIDGKSGEIKNINREYGISNDYIMCISEAKDGSVWIGTDGGGVFVLKNRHLEKVFKSSSGLAGNVVFKISSEFDDSIWICTGTGLSVYQNGNFVNFNSSNGFETDSVFQVLYDGKERVWCTSNRGIFSVKASDLQSVLEGKTKTVKSRFYGANDGILSGGVTSTSKSCRDSNNKIWFTLIDGFCIYEPSSHANEHVKPLVHVEEVSVDLKKYDFEKGEVIIPPCPKRININYTGLCFVSSEHMLFRTKLEGFETDFNEWSADRSVSYTNLKPGTYKLYLMAQNADGIQSQLDSYLTLIVKPAFYQQTWFWILIIFAFVGLLYFAGQRRVAYLKFVRQKLEDLVQERTKELTELQHTLEAQVSERTSELRQEKDRVQQLSVEVTKALAGTIDAKDKYTNGHSVRVAEYSKLLAASLGKSDEEIENIYYAGLLHDIGKIGVPDAIINKPDKLTDEEFEIIKTHPAIGSEILKSIESMTAVSVGARWHHERYDGKGYPDHLKGTEIPELARIICVADAYDAMTSNRSYRKFLPQDVVRKQIQEGRGTQFDPEIADKMLEIIDFDTTYEFHEKD